MGIKFCYNNVTPSGLFKSLKSKVESRILFFSYLNPKSEIRNHFSPFLQNSSKNTSFYPSILSKKHPFLSFIYSFFIFSQKNNKIFSLIISTLEIIFQKRMNLFPSISKMIVFLQSCFWESGVVKKRLRKSEEKIKTGSSLKEWKDVANNSKIFLRSKRTSRDRPSAQ